MTTTTEESSKSQPGDVLRYADAAAYLSVPLGSLYALVHEKRVPHFRLSSRTVLFRRSELEAWLAQHRVVPALTNNP